MTLRFVAAVCAACSLTLTAPSFAQEQSASSPGGEPIARAAPDQRIRDAFPEIAASDLPFDDAYRLGVLDNGMRYVIRSNATPPERGAVRMWVDFGSIHETDEERGFAHFIEHMAFNGTTNLPGNEMLRLLEREGLAFGADTNASTGFDATQYRLDLPRNDADLLGTALMLMREVASEVTFDPAAVEDEKGIILSERRTRDTFGLRANIDNLEFLYPQSRLAQRMPIGTIETIENASADGLRDLYARYYRPQNIGLVVVGDYDVDAVEAAIRQRFGGWQGDAPLPDVAFGPIDTGIAGLTDIHLDPALSEQVVISRMGAWVDEPDTLANRQQTLLRNLAYRMISRRMQRLSREEDAPFRGAGLGTSDVFEEARQTRLSVAAAEGEWQRGLAAAQAEYRRALAFGFSQAELDEQLANIRRSLENSVEGAATRSNGGFISGALAVLRRGRVPTTPQSGLERFEAQLAGITPEAVLAALQAHALPLDNPLIRFQGRTAPEGGADALRASWDAGMELAVEAGESVEMAEFAYTDFGPAGEVISDTTDERLDIRTLRFANGVMLNLKPTQLSENRVMLRVDIDGGDMLATLDNPYATALAGALRSGGLGAHSLDELQTIIAGRGVGLIFRSNAETFFLAGSTTPDSLEFQLQLMAASITDPGYRPDAQTQYYRNIENAFAALNATPANALRNASGGILYDNHPRFSLGEKEDYLALDFAKLRGDISDRLDNGAIEIALVGDFEEEAAIAMVASTFGALPMRESDFQSYADNRERRFTQDRSVRTLYHEGADDQALIRLAWPTRDDSDLRESLTLELLERVARIRLQETLREELGQTYSPSVSASQSTIYPGNGTFFISAQIDVADVDATREAMLAVLMQLRTAEADDDLLMRARQPMLESYDNALETNGSWMGLVARAQTRGDRIDRFLMAQDTLLGISWTDIQTMAQRYLTPRERLEILVLPRSVATTQ